MATYKPACWVRDNCDEEHGSVGCIWDCPGCELEVCEACFWMLGHCRDCSENVDEDILKDYANSKGFDFS